MRRLYEYFNTITEYESMLLNLLVIRVYFFASCEIMARISFERISEFILDIEVEKIVTDGIPYRKIQSNMNLKTVILKPVLIYRLN